MPVYSMEKKEELIRNQMRNVSRELLETLASPQIPYFNIFDPEGRLIATVDGSNDQVYTYRKIDGCTSLSHHSIDEFKMLIQADAQLKEEKRPLIVDEDYEQAVTSLGCVKRVFYVRNEDDDLLKKRKKECCWFCCLY